jgi:hypothetical protein
MSLGRKVFEWVLTAVMFSSVWYWKFSPYICIFWLLVLLGNAFWHIFSVEKKVRKLTIAVEKLSAEVQNLRGSAD